MDAINKATEAYRKAINVSKVKLRNQYIGHRTQPTSNSYLQPDEYWPLVKLAVELLDLLASARVPCVLKGNGVPDIDLRERLGI